ncbi:MAG: hypothetical protein Q9207_003300, partial [Kuettlingeria erythrocarpa]
MWTTRLGKRYGDVVATTWHLGFTAFGGPAVQFQTFHKIFVEEQAWIDETTYQQIFAISQALPGSASAKMLFCINAVRGGLSAGFLATAFFCLPGAIGMYGLSVGIARVGDTLPAPVYALLSGLNAATIGIIALAAVNLAGRAITDELTRVLVFLGGALGMLYTALWYYPVVMVGAGLTTMAWDLRWPHTLVGYAVVRPWRRIRMKSIKEANAFDAEKGHESWPRRTSVIHENIPSSEKPLPAAPRNSEISSLTETDARYLHPRPVPIPVPVPISKFAIIPTSSNFPSDTPLQHSQQQPSQQQPTPFPTLLTLRTGSLILILFALSFLALLLLRALLHHQEEEATRPFALFSSLYLAGTIIFGGGPVVIPLLRSYLVAPGWVSPRDFLLGLAIIQAFPGPNFNFA